MAKVIINVSELGITYITLKKNREDFYFETENDHLNMSILKCAFACNQLNLSILIINIYSNSDWNSI
mgnify:CR=1 FL=1